MQQKIYHINNILPYLPAFKLDIKYLSMNSLGDKPKLLKEIVEWAEKSIIVVLIAVMSFLLLVSTLELIFIVIASLGSGENGVLLVDLDNLLNIFGVFLLVLIGIELLDTIKVYFKENVIHVEVVILVALIAIARKVIVLDFEHYTGLEILGISAIIIALSGGYYLLKKTGSTGILPSEEKPQQENEPSGSKESKSVIKK